MGKLALCLILLLLIISRAQAQVQTFPLHKPITEEVFICLEKGDAIDVLSAIRKGPEDFKRVAHDKVTNAQCGSVLLSVTYREVVYEVEQGGYYAVFRGTAGTETIFIPAVNWKAQGVSI